MIVLSDYKCILEGPVIGWMPCFGVRLGIVLYSMVWYGAGEQIGSSEFLAWGLSFMMIVSLEEGTFMKYIYSHIIAEVL